MATETLTLLQREAFENQFLRKHSSTIVCTGRPRSSLEPVPQMPTIVGECSSNNGDRKAPPAAQVSEALEKLVARIKASHSAVARQPSKEVIMIDVPVSFKANGQLTATNPPKVNGKEDRIFKKRPKLSPLMAKSMTFATNPPKVNGKEDRICKKRPKLLPLMAKSSRLYESMKARRH